MMADSEVSLRDIIAVQERMADIQARIELKIDEKFEKLEKRIAALETFQNRTLGVLSVVSTFVSLAATYIWNKVIGKTN